MAGPPSASLRRLVARPSCNSPVRVLPCMAAPGRRRAAAVSCQKGPSVARRWRRSRCLHQGRTSSTLESSPRASATTSSTRRSTCSGPTTRSIGRRSRSSG
eukprot:7070255-Lingulodinium_polyedra.AAC.1